MDSSHLIQVISSNKCKDSWKLGMNADLENQDWAALV